MTKRNFTLIVSAVMATLGISAFAKNADKKSVLTADQRKTLADKWGEQFVTSFLKDLAESEADGEAIESAVEENAGNIELQHTMDNKMLKEMREQMKLMQDTIDKMAAQPADPVGGIPVNKPNPDGNKPGFKPDMSLEMNRMYIAMAEGDAWTGNETINADELKTEFGRYVSSEKLSIFRTLMGQTSSTQFMSTIMTDKFEVRASQSNITSVLQTFTPQFTPKGKTTFTPMTIKQYPMKINVAIIPSDIIDKVIGYLYDENLKPQDMPIVRYIVEQLIKPKLDEERETAFAMGRYKEPTKQEETYQPNEANQVCDGYITQLCDLKKAGDSKVNFLLTDLAELPADQTLLDYIEKAVDDVSPLYKNMKMFIHADPDVIIQYSRQYRNKFPNTKNEDGEKVKVDFSKFTFAPLEGMRGTGAFFITPKENFKHIMSRDPKTMSLRMETHHYQADIMGEWREGVGFWIQEAIFAYLPTELVDTVTAGAESLSAQTTEDNEEDTAGL